MAQMRLFWVQRPSGHADEWMSCRQSRGAPNAGSAGGELLRVLPGPGLAGLLQVPDARRREQRSDCGEVDCGCDPQGAAHPEPGRRHSCEGESERLA